MPGKRMLNNCLSLSLAAVEGRARAKERSGEAGHVTGGPCAWNQGWVGLCCLLFEICLCCRECLKMFSLGSSSVQGGTELTFCVIWGELFSASLIC